MPKRALAPVEEELVTPLLMMANPETLHMIEDLKKAATAYNHGFTSADEFLANVVTVVGARWQYLKSTRVDHATRDTALDVDELAAKLAQLGNNR